MWTKMYTTGYLHAYIVHISVNIHIHILPTYLPTHLPTYLTYLPIFPSIHPSIYPSSHISASPEEIMDTTILSVSSPCSSSVGFGGRSRARRLKGRSTSDSECLGCSAGLQFHDLGKVRFGLGCGFWGVQARGLIQGRGTTAT